MIEVVEFQFEEKYIKDFLKLPQLLYGKDDLMEDKKSVEEILRENHILSKYFKIYKFVVYKDKVIYRKIFDYCIS